MRDLAVEELSFEKFVDTVAKLSMDGQFSLSLVLHFVVCLLLV